MHVLNNFQVAMDLSRYSRKHDEVFKVIEDFVRTHLPPQFMVKRWSQFWSV